MRKSYLDLFTFVAWGVGQRPDVVVHILVDISCDLANDSRRTRGLQRADRAVVLVGPVDDVVLIDVAGAGQRHTTWADKRAGLSVIAGSLMALASLPRSHDNREFETRH